MLRSQNEANIDVPAFNSSQDLHHHTSGFMLMACGHAPTNQHLNYVELLNSECKCPMTFHVPLCCEIGCAYARIPTWSSRTYRSYGILSTFTLNARIPELCPGNQLEDARFLKQKCLQRPALANTCALSVMPICVCSWCACACLGSESRGKVVSICVWVQSAFRMRSALRHGGLMYKL